MAKCCSCGKEIEDNDEVCRWCGAIQSQDDAEVVEDSSAEENKFLDFCKKNYKLIAIVVAVLVLILVVSLILANGNKKSNESSKTTSTTVEEKENESETPTETTTEQSTEKPIDYTVVYAELISKYKNILITHPDADSVGEDCFLFAMDANYNENLKYESGYAIMDINGDSVPEFIVSNSTPNYEGQVYALYTCKDGKPQFLAASQYRGSCYILKDGTVLEDGSWSAFSYMLKRSVLTSDGTLCCKDCYYTDDSDFNNIKYIHNTTGEVFDNAGEFIDKSTFDIATSSVWENEKVIFELNHFD